MHTHKTSLERLVQLLANSNGYKPAYSQTLLSTKPPQSLLKPQTQDRVFSCILPCCLLGQHVMHPYPQG